ncbi:unnamed protein product (macronuclear) [Paramecium tetraurelia]|uniref:Palmitoyltransferase n=1 Tax=Paramecium tetraurelia TaxID=5888 RepID=A0C7K8_PARTE|nr:uncharacterized protein GSPATT00035905001 [Paramecium tetraurelia]CAK66775.1 unnamed protein product [Paramecium tetraurelia]|eukprot:XP_001434172.1 hypothetical protein (macronuclear) [Paramecium tetraurelia strain d4-2]
MNQNKQQLVHLYQLWPSNNRFLCRGRLMTGPSADHTTNLITWILILLIGAPFIVYISPQIWIVLHPSLPIISYVMYFSCVLFLFLTQFTDPGIIPRKDIIEKMKDENLLHLIPTEADNSNYNIRICITCMIKKPPRSNHCAECDNCVDVFDHHCPFVNNCIGKRNYAYFISFISTLTMAAISFGIEFLCFVILIATNDEKVQQILIIILMVPFGICILLVFGLLVFHIFLIITGKTTKEQLKNIEMDSTKRKCERTKSLFNCRLIVEKQKYDQIRYDYELVDVNPIIIPA